ncbi:MAG: hypothetical protein OXG81_05430 [Acidobacteria bacterium]|nr:hypothetical protein [Acidobacteriota bacterium]
MDRGRQAGERRGVAGEGGLNPGSPLRGIARIAGQKARATAGAPSG